MLVPAFPISCLLFSVCSRGILPATMEDGMAAVVKAQKPRMERAHRAAGRHDAVSDEEVEEAIALFGGDPREAVRALVGALHRLVSRGDARGQVRGAPSSPAVGLRERACAHEASLPAQIGCSRLGP